MFNTFHFADDRNNKIPSQLFGFASASIGCNPIHATGFCKGVADTHPVMVELWTFEHLKNVTNGGFCEPSSNCVS